jgi:hypothetical protein
MASKSNIPLSERINFRMVLLIGVVLLLVGYPVFIFIQSEVTHGISDAGGGYTEVDLKAMGNFAFDQVNGRLIDIPQRFRELNGKKVLLHGEIYAPDSASEQLDHFDLCYSIAKCCFSGPPQVQHFVKSRATRELVPYYGGLVDVRGVLHVNVVPGMEKVASVYQLDVESVEPPSDGIPTWVWITLIGAACAAAGVYVIRRLVLARPRRNDVARPVETAPSSLKPVPGSG